MSADPEVGREEPKKPERKSQYAEEMFERVRARVAVHPPQCCYGGREDFHRGSPSDFLEGRAGGRDPGAGDWDADFHDEDFFVRAELRPGGKTRGP